MGTEIDEHACLQARREGKGDTKATEAMSGLGVDLELVCPVHGWERQIHVGRIYLPHESRQTVFELCMCVGKSREVGTTWPQLPDSRSLHFM